MKKGHGHGHGHHPPRTGHRRSHHNPIKSDDSAITASLNRLSLANNGDANLTSTVRLPGQQVTNSSPVGTQALRPVPETLKPGYYNDKPQELAKLAASYRHPTPKI